MFFKKKCTKQKVQQAKDQIQDQIVSSKAQVDPMLTEIVDKADELTVNVKDAADEHLVKLSKQVKAKPIKAVVVSAIVGYLLGRITR